MDAACRILCADNGRSGRGHRIHCGCRQAHLFFNSGFIIVSADVVAASRDLRFLVGKRETTNAEAEPQTHECLQIIANEGEINSSENNARRRSLRAYSPYNYLQPSAAAKADAEAVA